MAPRSGNKKRRKSSKSSAANGGYYYNDSSVAPPPAIYLDDDMDNIKFMGFTLPGPVSTLLRSLGGVPGQLASLTPMKIIVYGSLAAVLLAPLVDSTIRQSMSLLRGDGSKGAEENNGIIGDALPHVTNDGKFHGRYPNSLLTLFYPFTLFRDVVLDQPVEPTDVPFFWHAHVSDELAVKAVLTKCYEADLVELNSVEDIEKAKRFNLVSTLVSQDRIGEGSLNKEYYNGQRSKPLVITSPHIREAAELFSQENSGRMFSFYRHPIDYDVHPNLKKKLPPEAGANNFMTRLLSNVHTGPLGFKELGIAKQVIRQTTLAGSRDLMAESLFRFGKYFGWVPAGGKGLNVTAVQDDELAVKCIEEMLEGVPGERYADHNSKEWAVFYKANKLDCQLYEIARSTWRAQIQTIIPLTLQKTRAEKEER
mmetsp:Transcript_5030/g.11310  ORF Transcript_5030/g.11310 Transcript_5030/m.11310 type:complete len:423 (+) Transcript_5030:181-1449(+)